MHRSYGIIHDGCFLSLEFVDCRILPLTNPIRTSMWAPDAGNNVWVPDFTENWLSDQRFRTSIAEILARE